MADVEIQKDSRGQSFVWLGDYTDLEVEHIELRNEYNQAQEDLSEAWSQYHTVYAEYAVLREAYDKLKKENQENYLRRKHAERRLAKEHQAACQRIINQQ